MAGVVTSYAKVKRRIGEIILRTGRYACFILIEIVRLAYRAHSRSFAQADAGGDAVGEGADVVVEESKGGCDSDLVADRPEQSISEKILS